MPRSQDQEEMLTGKSEGKEEGGLTARVESLSQHVHSTGVDVKELTGFFLITLRSLWTVAGVLPNP